MEKLLHIGLDIGSTTIKIVVLNRNEKIIYSKYMRHFSDIKNHVKQFIQDIYMKYSEYNITLNISGSVGLAISEQLSVPFIQEVIACSLAVEEFIGQIDVAIELGGEDA